MNKLKKLLIAAISISVAAAFCLLIVIVFRIISGGNEGVNESLASAVSIFGIVSGIGTVVSLLQVVFSILNDNASNIRNYYNAAEVKEVAEARHLLYKYRDFKAATGFGVYSDCDFDAVVASYAHDEKLNVESKKKVSEAASKIANFYQMWGLLYKNGSLPVRVFKTSDGYGLLRLYDAIEDIIIEKQKGNPLYAKEFVDLCEVVKKKYKIEIKPSEYASAKKKEANYPKIEA